MLAPRSGGPAVVWTSLIGLMLLASTAAAQNQQPRVYPNGDYLLTLAPFYDGEYKDARRGFQQSASGAVRVGDVRWVDSICYHTMIGECYYQIGERAEALDQYTSALQMFLTHKNWLLRVEFPDAPREASIPKLEQITWGRPQRTTLFAQFPDSMLSAQGQLNNDQVIMKGGVVAPPQYLQLRVTEVLRCTALALARRREIMGPVCEHDPLTNQLLDALSRRPAPPNHWSQAWVSVQLGLAYFSAGKKAEAAVELTKGLQISGRYDHPLTPIALLELGKIAYSEGKYDIAATMFYEATFPAVAYDQFDVVEEAFRWGHLTHTVANQKGVYKPLIAAQPWAKSKGSKAVQASICVSAAEAFTNNGDPGDAASMLTIAAGAMNRSDMLTGNLGARYHYEQARVAFANGKLAAGNTALAACMTFQKGGSSRLYQITLADRLYTSGQIRVDRVAETLYDDVLREPTAADWRLDPLETMTVVMIPHVAPMEHWFEVAVKRKQVEKAAEIADRIRRHRFYSTVPTGGRVLALRWILEAPESILSDAAKQQRRDLLAKYPQLDALSKKAAELQTAIAALPRVPADNKALKEQAEIYTQLGIVSASQEVLLSDIALRREPSEFVFPPLLSVKEVQAKLRPGQAVMAYFTTTRYVVGFAINKDNCRMWQLTPNDTTKVKQDFAALLKAWGHTDKNSIIPSPELRKTEWKPIAQRMLASLTNNAKAEHFDDIDELIIVPDGILWYVPFEALQLEENGATVPLISKVRMRYAPTLSLVTPDGRPMPNPAETMIVAGRMYSKEDPAIAQDTAAAIAKAMPGAFVAPAQLPGVGSLYSSTIDRLIVLDDITESEQNRPYDWTPLRVDEKQPGSALSQWATLPWGGPQQVVIPGYHTPVERGLKGGGAGDEIFLSVMGLMTSGSRTVLLSRWRTAGQSGYDLVREFSQELPHTSASNAWQRAVQMVSTAPLDLGREPRVRAAAADEMLTAEHPFFWSGYILVDTGAEPPKSE